VSFEADPVTGPVEESFAVPLGVDRPSRGRIHRFARDPGRDRGPGGGLRAMEYAEQVAEPLVGAVRGVPTRDPQRPGDVRAIPSERASDVKDDRLGDADDPLGCLVMWRRGVGSGPHDCEVRLVMTLGDEAPAHLVGDVGFGPPHEAAPRDLRHDPVRGVGRERQERDLVRVLDHAQLTQDGRRQ
jgi:hypothetical protein